MVNPASAVVSSSDSVTPGGGLKVNFWIKPVKKMKSSIMARLSPMQFLRPAMPKAWLLVECLGKWWLNLTPLPYHLLV